jgi:predicted GNAT family acetyltransferase
MATSEDEILTPERFNRENYSADMQVPVNDAGYLKTGFDSLKTGAVDGLAEGAQLTQKLGTDATLPPFKEIHAAMIDSLKTLQQSVHADTDAELNNPNMSTPQKYWDEFASFIGGLANPLAIATGGGGGALTEGGITLLGTVARKVAPDIAGKVLDTTLAEGLSEGTKKVIPSKILAANLGEAGTSAGIGFGAGVGAALPFTVADNYDKDSGKFNVKNIVKDLAVSGAFGMGINSTVYLGGLLFKGKTPSADVLRESYEDKETVAHSSSYEDAQQAAVHLREKGEIQSYNIKLDKETDTYTTTYRRKKGQPSPETQQLTPEEHRFIQQHVTADMTEREVDELASQILAKRGINVDTATHEVPVKIVHEDDINHMQGGIFDQLNSDLEGDMKHTLTDFLAAKNIDRLATDHNAIDGLRGLVEHVGERLKDRDSVLQKFDERYEASPGNFLPEIKARVDKIKEKLLPDSEHKLNIDENENRIKISLDEDPNAAITLQKTENGLMISSSYVPEGKRAKGIGKALYIKAIKLANSRKLKLFSDVTVSDDAMRVYEALEKIGYTFNKNETAYKVLQPGLKRNYFAVSNAKPIYELVSSPEKKSRLIDNHRNTKEYSELYALAKKYSLAKVLKNRIDREDEFNKEEAFAKVAQHLIDVSDNHEAFLTKPEKIGDYMQAKMDNAFKGLDEGIEKDTLQKVEDRKTVPADTARLFADNEELMKTQSEDTKQVKEYRESKGRFDEFKTKGKVLSNLIKCLLGAAE